LASSYGPDGGIVLTNALIANGTILNRAAGNLTVTNLLAPSAAITTISVNTINAPTATLNNLTPSGVTRGLFMPNGFGGASLASAQPEKKIAALGLDASGPALRVASAVSGPVALTQGLEDALDRETKEKASVATTDRRLLRFSKMIPSLSNTETDKKGAVKAEAAPPEPSPAGDDPAKPQTPPPVSPLIPQPEIAAAENSFSTFSLNVADVSFKLAAASLANGAMPDRNSIRSEEFVNALNYHDPEPPPGSPIGFTWERARYPFIQNREILRFAVRTAATGREANKPLNLVLLLDHSGSMDRADRVRIVREAIQTLANQLKVGDRFSVVTFARTARLFADGVTGDKAGTIVESLSGITPEGGTNLEDALRLGYETASRHFQNNGVNRVILFTDGAANLGDLSPESLRDRVETWRKRGVALDCFGIGWDGLNDDLLEKLSRNGDGRYGFLNSPEEAGGEFANKIAGALHVAAADVKVQVEFNPQRVNLWRQIGYATHQLTKEQFRDNKVDAAELAAAESGNALYLAETKSDGSGPIATVHVRHRDPGTGLFQEHEWRIPYDGPAPLLERAPATLRLATTAAAFSEWLSGLPYAAEVTPDRLLQLIQGLPSEAGPDRRPHELETMIQQARSLVGK
jgi:secreted protein with Ig-like and vWFA domain